MTSSSSTPCWRGRVEQRRAPARPADRARCRSARPSSGRPAGRRHVSTIIQAHRRRCRMSAADALDVANRLGGARLLPPAAARCRRSSQPAGGDQSLYALRRHSASSQATCRTATPGIRSRPASSSSTRCSGASGRTSRSSRPPICWPRRWSAWLLVVLGRRPFGGTTAGWARPRVFLLLGDPSLQRLSGVYVRGAVRDVHRAGGDGRAGARRRRRRAGRGMLVLAGVCLGVAFWLKYNALAYALPVAASPRSRRAIARDRGPMATSTRLRIGMGVAARHRGRAGSTSRPTARSTISGSRRSTTTCATRARPTRARSARRCTC